MTLQEFKNQYEFGLDHKALRKLADMHPNALCCAKIRYNARDDRPKMNANDMADLIDKLSINPEIGHVREVWIV